MFSLNQWEPLSAVACRLKAHADAGRFGRVTNGSCGLCFSCSHGHTCRGMEPGAWPPQIKVLGKINGYRDNSLNSLWVSFSTNVLAVSREATWAKRNDFCFHPFYGDVLKPGMLPRLYLVFRNGGREYSSDFVSFAKSRFRDLEDRTREGNHMHIHSDKAVWTCTQQSCIHGELSKTQGAHLLSSISDSSCTTFCSEIFWIKTQTKIDSIDEPVSVCHSLLAVNLKRLQHDSMLAWVPTSILGHKVGFHKSNFVTVQSMWCDWGPCGNPQCGGKYRNDGNLSRISRMMGQSWKQLDILISLEASLPPSTLGLLLTKVNARNVICLSPSSPSLGFFAPPWDMVRGWCEVHARFLIVLVLRRK